MFWRSDGVRRGIKAEGGRAVALAGNLQPGPIHARALSLDDVREYRRRHRDAIFRCRVADFDLVYPSSGRS